MGHNADAAVAGRRTSGADVTKETARVCPFSDETVVGCRHYVPVSEHGDFSTAGECRFVQTLQVTEHVRQKHCRRQLRPEAPAIYDQL
jgi:hypothetical protein